MPDSIFAQEVQAALDQARTPGGALFPSPEDWRDLPIYFLMLDRFNNPGADPKNMPYDASFGGFQGGTFEGVRAKLPYLKDLGAGAIWLSPVMKNPQFDRGAYHGYGIQNFLAIEPRFASSPEKAESELRQLIDDAHQLGIYVILDIVLHHAGDVFEYALPDGNGGVTELGSMDWQNQIMAIRWRDATGNGDPALAIAPANPPLDAAVWPTELRNNAFFTRQGNANSAGGQPGGDFDSLKGIRFDFADGNVGPANNVLIRAYQYIVARFDIDGFRIDTLKYIPPDFERIFGNSMREFALSAGKKNFFTFGEVYDNEQTIAQFIGRNTNATGDTVGVDAALDYPLFFKLPPMIKGQGPTPADLANVFENRKRTESTILTSHGEAGQYFVTFLDNHDQPQRFTYTGPTQLNDQITLGLGILFSLPGIPCVYYGTEQGLQGHKTPTQTDDSMVREALWGKKDAAAKPIGFDSNHLLYQAIRKIAQVRNANAALRYGRYYFRPVSGDGINFGLSTFPTGILAFSRILNDQEVIVVANTDTQQRFTGQIIIDQILNAANSAYRILFSNQGGTIASTAPVSAKTKGSVRIQEVDGSITDGPILTLSISLNACEFQILAV
ncbi:MAG TPA: alpha-amylase family glycosyl hydrolase [Tepidisphaeraceae bacterium]|jgi:glycosidase|nr:alpha-amylase family glycosyl hydrolase [Tepidisphaeraceae bacterium]